MQAVHMKIPEVEFKHASASMPVVWLSLADQIVIISKDSFDRWRSQMFFSLLVSIFILNSCVYKHLPAKNEQFSMRVRIVIGMIFATLSMCTTGVVEMFRQGRCDTTNSSQLNVIGLQTSIRILSFVSIESFRSYELHQC